MCRCGVVVDLAVVDLQLDSMILKIFSNLNDSMILWLYDWPATNTPSTFRKEKDWLALSCVSSGQGGLKKSSVSFRCNKMTISYMDILNN